MLSSSCSVLILIGGHLATAPRPQKQAAAIRSLGFSVSIRGIWWDERLAKEDLELEKEMDVDYAPVIDLRSGQPGRQWMRLRQRLAKEAFKHAAWVLPRAYGPGAPELLREALRMKAQLTMVHSEAGLWAGEKLLNRGLRVGVDFEDWFSQGVQPKEKGVPVDAIRRLERYLLHHAHITFTTTRVMAEAMARDAQCERIPQVIPNCFPWERAPIREKFYDIRNPQALSLYWFSQTIGSWRGLETLAKALVELKGKWELHLRGRLISQTWFEKTFPPALRKHIILHPSVPNCQLANHSASHDIGLALEEPDIVNRDLTATNKIFEYLRSGLALIATATQGQQEVMANCPNVGWIIPPKDKIALAAVLQKCLDHPEIVARARLAAREAAATSWAWEHYEKQLKESFLNVLQ